MKVLILAALIAVSSALVVSDRDHLNVVIGKESLVTVDIKTKELCILKLLNHILQLTVYDDIREVAREYVLEDNMDKYLRVDVVKRFIDTFKMGMLPRAEIFVHTNELHMDEAVKVFHLLYFAKDFDIFIRTCCWLRERINPGMFVYAVTLAVFHRDDCRGITLPAPYEIYPYYFVENKIINKAFIIKMTKGFTDQVMMNYYGVKMTDKNIVTIDSRKGVRHALTKADKLTYFTEDIDLNTYMYYLHMSYPSWMTDDVYGLHKERRGEVQMYALQQLLARYRLERLSHEMCDTKMLMWDKPLKTGYWPKLRLHNGEEMPMRSNDKIIFNDINIREKHVVDDLERIIREGIFKGRIELRDGTIINIKKAEDVEYLCRLILGGIGLVHDDGKTIHLMSLFKRILSYNMYNMDKYTYIPTALDMYQTCLRDPVYWKILKRVTEYVVLFKKLLPKYTRDELNFQGVKVEQITTDKLVTFMDEYDIDITNAIYLDEVELKKKHSDYIYVARQRRLNHHNFKVNIDVVSDKAVDAVVRVFIGPKYDCMGRLMKIHDKRLDMVEIDTFLHKLETGKNTIVRDSHEMHGVIDDRPWTRTLWDRVMESRGTNERFVENWWFKTRLGFPRRLLLPLGRLGGLDMQLFVIVTPVHTGLTLPTVDMNIMKERRTCRWSTCFDTMPLGFPFDREIDETVFYTHNMKFSDIKIYRKDMELANMSKDVDLSELVMKRDDLTYLDKDMLVKRSYRDVMMMSVDRMMRM